MAEIVVTPEARYLFDLRGYHVVRGVLDEAELRRLNQLMDDNCDARPGESIDSQRFGGFLLWGEAFRALLDHPRVVPFLYEWVDRSLRVDRYYGIFMRAGTSGLPLHGGAQELDDQSEYFLVRDGRMQNGVTTVIWALSDMQAGEGGFVCIPGSHKSNYPIPEQYDFTADCVTQVEMRAGDVLIFTGALAHGTHPWEAAHERRSLVFKYAPGHLAWGQNYLQWSPELLDAMTPRQRVLFAPPYAYRRIEVDSLTEHELGHFDPTSTFTT